MLAAKNDDSFDMDASMEQAEQIGRSKFGGDGPIGGDKSEQLTDEEASKIFDKLTKLNNRGNYKPKYRWSEDEYQLLIWAINRFCKGKGVQPKDLKKNDWQEISAFIPGRNDTQCYYRYNQQRRDCIKKSVWSKKEDDELVKIVKKYGTKHWNQIAQYLNDNLMDEDNENLENEQLQLKRHDRNGKQCRERWVNFLNPEIKKEPFSIQEDIFIL